MTRRRVIAGIAIGAVAIVLGWGLMTALARVLRQTDPPPAQDEQAPAAQTTPSPTPAVPKIKANLFFASEDGRQLVAVEQEIPLAEGTVAQARALVEAQLASAAPAPLASTIPAGTKLRGVYLSDKNEAFVDLDATVRDKHPGGSMNELFTVYTIVNAITTNLGDVQSVQLLIDGREVDTLAGHVDLRRPLRKNEALTSQAPATP
jgi:spore germination protein GerM